MPYGSTYSWLNFIAAVLFVLESSIELYWAIKRWRAEIQLEKDKEELASMNLPDVDSIHRDVNTDELPFPLLDKVHYDFWAAVWFLIPSLLTLAESFLGDGSDGFPVWSWLNVLSSSGVSDADFAVGLD